MPFVTCVSKVCNGHLDLKQVDYILRPETTWTLPGRESELCYIVPYDALVSSTDMREIWGNLYQIYEKGGPDDSASRPSLIAVLAKMSKKA